MAEAGGDPSAQRGPRKAAGLCGERTSDGESETSALAGGEGYAVREDDVNGPMSEHCAPSKFSLGSYPVSFPKRNGVRMQRSTLPPPAGAPPLKGR